MSGINWIAMGAGALIAVSTWMNWFKVIGIITCDLWTLQAVGGVVGGILDGIGYSGEHGDFNIYFIIIKLMPCLVFLGGVCIVLSFILHKSGLVYLGSITTLLVSGLFLLYIMFFTNASPGIGLIVCLACSIAVFVLGRSSRIGGSSSGWSSRRGSSGQNWNAGQGWPDQNWNFGQGWGPTQGPQDWQSPQDPSGGWQDQSGWPF